MESLHDEIRQNYIDGVHNLVGGKLKKEDILKRIEKTNVSCDVAPATIADDFWFLTKDLLSTGIDNEGKVFSRVYDGVVSDNFQNGMIESISQKVWEHAFGDATNPRKKHNPYWVENKIMDIFLELMGNDNLVMLGFIQNPDLMFGMVQDIKYQDESLLDYLNYHLDNATMYNVPREHRVHMERSTEVMACVEALSDCSQKLNIAVDYKKYVK